MHKLMYNEVLYLVHYSDERFSSVKTLHGGHINLEEYIAPTLSFHNLFNFHSFIHSYSPSEESKRDRRLQFQPTFWLPLKQVKCRWGGGKMRSATVVPMDAVMLRYASLVGVLPVSLIYSSVPVIFIWKWWCSLNNHSSSWLFTGALGQVMQRMHLSWYGRETGPASASVTCRTVAILFAAYLGCDYLFALIETIVASEWELLLFQWMDTTHITRLPTILKENVPPAFYFFYVLRGVMHFVFFLYMLISVINTRRYIRNKYAIPEACCHGMEDCCCAFWCPGLSIAQMARHTADYDTYSAKCCSETGLPPMAPSIVWSALGAISFVVRHVVVDSCVSSSFKNSNTLAEGCLWPYLLFHDGLMAHMLSSRLRLLSTSTLIMWDGRAMYKWLQKVFNTMDHILLVGVGHGTNTSFLA